MSASPLKKYSKYGNTEILKVEHKYSETAGVPQINNLRKFVSTQLEKR